VFSVVNTEYVVTLYLVILHFQFFKKQTNIFKQKKLLYNIFY